ncbi:MAG: hypothetical protein R2838_06960 [Caldilineaceae bacterium]
MQELRITAAVKRGFGMETVKTTGDFRPSCAQKIRVFFTGRQLRESQRIVGLHWPMPASACTKYWRKNANPASQGWRILWGAQSLPSPMGAKREPEDSSDRNVTKAAPNNQTRALASPNRADALAEQTTMPPIM